MHSSDVEAIRCRVFGVQSHPDDVWWARDLIEQILEAAEDIKKG